MYSQIIYVDANNLLHRVLKVNSSPILSTSQGVFTGGVYTFIRSLRYVAHKFSADRVVCVWDGLKSDRRLSLYPEYKSNRRPKTEEQKEAYDEFMTLWSQQYNILLDVLPCLGVHSLRHYKLEADDTIAYLSRKATSEGDQVIVVTSDQDYYQLVDMNTRVYRPIQDEMIGLNFEGVLDGLDMTPEKHLWMKAITGDPSDNIKGVYLVGPTRASSILKELNDLTLHDLYDLCSSEETPNSWNRVSEDLWTVQRNLDLMDLSKENITDEMIGDILLALNMGRSVDEDKTRYYLNILEFQRLLDTYEDWIEPFRRLS